MNKIFGEVKGIYNSLTYIEIIISFIIFIIGLILVSMSDISTSSLQIILCIISFVLSVYNFITFIKRGDILLYNMNIFFFIILLVLGVIYLVVDKINIIFGIFLIVVFLQKLIYGYVLKKFSERSYLMTIMVGVCLLVFAIFLFITKNISISVSISLVGYSLLDIVNVILLRKRSSYYIA